MTVKSIPEPWKVQQPAPVREWLDSLQKSVKMLEEQAASASGRFLGNEDVTVVVPADSVAGTVAALRTDFNALLAILRAL